MKAETKERGDTLVCRLSGTFGFAAYDTFNALLSGLSATKKQAVEFDLSGLSSIDSAAVAMLGVAREETQRLGRLFCLTGARGEVARLLQLTHFHGLPESVGVETMPLEVRVVAEGDVPAAFIAECRELGLLCGEDGARAGAALIRYGSAGEAQIEQLGLQWQGYYEAAGDGISGIGGRCLEAVRGGGLALSVLTSSSCALDLPKLFEAAVRRRFPLGKRESDGLIALCLAEAVSNAVIHGNLGIASGLRATREGFARFREAMNERLADPVRSKRRVDICLLPAGGNAFTISVTDQGDGFDLERQFTRQAPAGDKQGRGLGLIRRSARSVHAEDGGRTLVMVF